MLGEPRDGKAYILGMSSDLNIWPAHWIIKLIHRQGIKLWGEKKYMWKSSNVAKALGLELYL